MFRLESPLLEISLVTGSLPIFINQGLRGGSRAAATSKTECFVIIVNGCKPLTIITKRSIMDVAAVLDPPLELVGKTFLMSKLSFNPFTCNPSFPDPGKN